MYYDLEPISLEKYDNGQLLLYTNTNNIPTILIVEKMNYYSVKLPGLPTETGTDPFYIINTIDDLDIKPISEETHPEIFFKLGFRIESNQHIKEL